MLVRSLLLLSTLSLSAAVEIPFKTVGAMGADYPTVQAAIDAVPAGNPSRKIILIQPGAFFGHTVLDKPFVTLRGSGPGTLLTFNLGQEIPGGDMRPLGWRGAAALLVTADDAIIENLSIENTYGKGMQAQACSVEADRVAFSRCRITFTHGNPPSYLGRPWSDSPSATFVRCELGAGIRADGWKEWNVKPPLVRFAEYACHGPGAVAGGRVAWATTSSGPAPVDFSRECLLGDWKC